MKNLYFVEITQTLKGIEMVEADSFDAAIALVEDKYMAQGNALPEMEDTEPLHFKIVNCDGKELFNG